MDVSAVSVLTVSLRVNLRSPFGDIVVRDIVNGTWQEPGGDAKGIMGDGLWALPGLVDAHSHIASDVLYMPGDLAAAMTRARESLRAGVTLLLDKGWTDETAIEVINRVPRTDRPEMEAAAKIIASVGGYYPGFATEIEGGDMAGAVESAAASGRGWIKLSGDWPRKGIGPVANFTQDELGAAVRTAEENGARVAIHTMARDVPSMAVAAGVHSIEHGLFLAETDLDDLGSRGGMWVPTILRIEETVVQLGENSSGGRLLAEGLTRVRALLPLALEAGIHVLAGTDLVGSPANVGSEALMLAEYGLSNRQALEAVSVDGFAATDRDGCFEIGSPADAVFFGANPMQDLGVLAHPEAVIRLGSII